MCKSCVGRTDLDLDVIGLRVFPLPLTGEATIWFIELPYNSIFHLEPTKGRFLSTLLPSLQETKPQRQSGQLCGTTKESQLVVLGIDSPHF